MKMRKEYILKESPISFVINDYPKEFTHGYLENKRFARCPVLHSAFNQKNRAARWRELFDASKVSSKFQEQLEWGSQFKVTNGISCPIHGPDSEFAILHFVANDEKSYSESELLEIKETLSIFSTLIHEKINMTLSTEKNDSNVHLTNREFECLCWAAKGKTVWETAQILQIAESTAREYIVNCMTKLNAATKVEAVTKAMVLNLLKYTDIIAT